jgi:lipopolysaccharide/colanic/teichoic acid biosynthesis glycosyltransferase
MTVHATSIRRSTDIAPITATPSAHRHGIYRLGFKRLADVLAILVTLPIVLPFMVIVAVVIAFDGASPFFRQERIGKDGRRFTIWKFRTMVPDAEAQLERYLDGNDVARLEWTTKQKLSVDPRVTRVGRLLRRTSLDELPQLLNVLRGDMSLIGPRPMMPCQQALYPGKAYYNLRPGMTGSWQISARHTSDFSDRAKYDDAYDRDVTFTNDLRILLGTVSVVLRGTGV